ncbi:unnamed protein product [Rhodiola kirilowii]
MAQTPAASSAARDRKVRVIAKIRGATKTPSSNWISVSTSHNISSISFLDQSNNNGKHTYELDHCYEPNDDNSTIFSAEIKPLVSWVFGGHCASIVAFGATASGKSYTVQGSDSNPGLAALAMEEFLLMADKAAMSVAISYYEVYQDQVYDLLNKSDNAVSVLENAQGKIQLKGLSQSFVKSRMEFQKLYLYDSHRKTQKTASQPSRKSHRGLIIHVLSSDENANGNQLIGRMNFVDLAGFGDPRGKSINTYALAENSRINKSLYALQSVVYALNCNDSRVPYRDSKLTYMLRDSLSGANKILMIACLNPTVCQDTIYMVNLASRCSKGSRRVFMDPLKKIRSTKKSIVNLSSKEVEKSVTSSLMRSEKSSGLKKKLTSSRFPLSERKTNNANGATLLGGRKLFDKVKHGYTVEKVSAPVDIVSDTLQAPEECVSCLPDIVLATTPPTQEMVGASVDIVSDTLQAPEECVSCLPDIVLSTTSPTQEMISAPVDIVSDMQQALEEFVSCLPDNVSATISDTQEMEKRLEVVDCLTLKASLDEEDSGMETEKQLSGGNEGLSPPLSARLQELSNYLKSLQSSTPLNKDTLQDIDTAVIEPKTPEAIHSMIVTATNNNGDSVVAKIETTNCINFVEPETPVANMNKWDDTVIASPWTTLNVRSTGVKKCLTEECVRFINSASKEELKGLKGIGDKRATYIMQFREKSPEHFKNIEDLKDVGLSAKQVPLFQCHIVLVIECLLVILKVCFHLPKLWHFNYTTLPFQSIMMVVT